MKKSNRSIFGIEVKTLVLPAILGAIIPTALLAFLILANSDSFAPWMVSPLLIIPAGGASGGIFFYLIGFLWFPKGNQKLIAILFSSLIYIVAIWISSVLAFNFTGHWN
ncbi:potassium transporter KefB [Algoriphagus sp. CAU 1675]|uniref:potassium transporter KefB n=1 Tax=Algoriphagus sp. CAU 1675 TaxID=3032597 RepID=UPI0023DA96D5|nr:potassium transporter KefB [Algoriphagus sp. CAU 1675]MDF2158586.1 potassium transporter KefB [Algoriphagus sp. CAU 1675]